LDLFLGKGGNETYEWEGGFAIKIRGLQIFKYGALGQITKSNKVKESEKVI
jgi:hypothetical protein